MSDTGVVKIHGKEYLTVARRIADFREAHPDYTITTKILSSADLVQVRAVIKNEVGRVLAVGHAEEKRGSTTINQTSSLENCETSAVGRCLAFIGMGGTEIASADEVAGAIVQQQELEQVEKLKEHNAAVRDHLPSIMAIKEALSAKDWSTAYECIHELKEADGEAWNALWIAPSKGGIWTTAERSEMKSNEMHEAKTAFHGE
jgi:hypothetical protein